MAQLYPIAIFLKVNIKLEKRCIHMCRTRHLILVDIIEEYFFEVWLFSKAFKV